MTDDIRTPAGAGRHIVAAGVGFLLVLALLAFPLDLAPRGAGKLASERAHARIEAVTPATDVAPPLARVLFVEGRLAGRHGEDRGRGG